MQINASLTNAYQPAYAQKSAAHATHEVARLEAERAAQAQDAPRAQGSPELRKAFDQFVGQTFFSQLMSEMRKSTGKPAYFHGGRGEEVFQGQLDQIFTERMTEASADTFTGPMYDLFLLGRP